MKKVLNFLLVAILLVVYSCQDETILVNETTTTKDQLQTKSQNNLGQEELIILYPKGTTETEKQQKRNEYGVTDYKQCACAIPAW